MATCLHPPPISHHHKNLNNTRHVPLESFYSPAALASSDSSSISSFRSSYSSNILIHLDIPSSVRREQGQDQDQVQEQEQHQEQEHFPDFFVSRPHSTDDFRLQVPLGRPPIPRPARRHKKNMTDIIGTTTAAEFDELPIAVRRKYFSTLERLRLANNLDSINTANDLDPPVSKKRSIAERRQLRAPLVESHHTNSAASASTSRRLRKSSRAKSITVADASWFLSLPDKIRRKQFTKEEQIRLAGRRDSVILDAADEAIYKASRRNRVLTPQNPSPFPSSRLSMDSSQAGTASERPTSMALAMAESFRWMDEEPDLDLRLVLDDYHANLPDVVIPTPASSIRPSFRRHMSITKAPFGRPSLSSPTRSTSSTTPLPATHTRQRSRAVSLISPRLASSLYGDDATPRPSIDPHATHYQDPEARLKLRVYLASPQKFDEAIEFGFPSDDGVLDLSTCADPDANPAARLARSLAMHRSGLSGDSHTFLDDGGSLLDDDASMADPESPRTPHEPAFREPQQHQRIASLHRHADSYALAAPGTREMTLRMTLTRPDLRADVDSMYGWQGARSKSPLATEEGEAGEVQAGMMRGPFEGPDGWGALGGREEGVVKRLWKRVRRERKTSSNFGH